ncbi:site-specific DNA methyltransferase [uncultured archaeal virus]|jgi:DNA adenine methylase|uniref:Site-specific DNA methyltransferase n=1 Tax=uncultured archaeal virus TaxID=1960247 RepID=A0A1S5Y2Z8_9VIRU|nr:site-specific DNA methyltransferase [uncultured archaeal virus]
MRLYICRYIGGLWYALWGKNLYQYFPEHYVFVDLFSGLGQVTLNKKRSKLEVINDIDDNIYNLFLVLRNNFQEFEHKFRYLIYSRKQFEEYMKQYKKDRLTSLEPVERAIAFFYLLNTTMTTLDSGFRRAVTRGTRFLTCFSDKVLERLELVRRRLKGVLIERLDFRDCIKKYDSPSTFFFCDPPFMVKRRLYEFDMTKEDHYELAEFLSNIEGKFLLIHVENEDFYDVYGQFNILAKMKKQKAMEVKAKNREFQTYVLIGNYKIEESLKKWL